MPEISLVKPLSGGEALESLLYELGKVLSKNGRFQSHMAYPGYRAEIVVRFYPSASFIPESHQTIEINQVPEGAVVSLTPTVDETIEIPVRPPNQVREEADMPTPVLTTDENNNPVEKWVNRKGQRPKNKVRGGAVLPGQNIA